LRYQAPLKKNVTVDGKTDWNIIDNVLHEIRLAKKFRTHPNFNRYITAFIYKDKNGLSKITMHFLLAELGNFWKLLLKIHDEIKSSKSADEREALIEKFEKALPVYYIQLLKGIQHSHEKGVLLMDFKPANVLFGMDEIAMITDFGLSVEETNIGRLSQLCGTFAYAAPEALENNMYDYIPLPTKQADIWSFGVTMFDAICGKFLFYERYWCKTARQTYERQSEFTANKSDFRSRLFGLITTPFSEGFKAKVVDFTLKTLEWDPDERSSIKELLQHPLLEDVNSDSYPKNFLSDLQK